MGVLPLKGRDVVVIGASGGVGRRIVAFTIRAGARVLAVARQAQPLQQLARDLPGVEVLCLDAAADGAPQRVFNVAVPDVLVLCAGVWPPAAPLHALSWREFGVNWEADARIAFEFCKAALRRPLPAGAVVIQIVCAAAFNGSPNSGGYAGAKRTQVFIANYAQKESDRLGLDLRFTVLAPCLVPGTELGGHIASGYARYLGMTEAEFDACLQAHPTSSDIAKAVVELAVGRRRSKATVFIVSENGLEVKAP